MYKIPDTNLLLIHFISANSAVLEALKKKAEPPSEAEFTRAYQKCKYGINIVAKLGHHLSSPDAGELVRGIFMYLRQLVNINKG